MKKHFLASALLFASLTAGTLGLGAAQAQEGPGWGPGHAMMWGGPTRNWMGWGRSEHFCGKEGERNVARFMALIARDIKPTDSQRPNVDALKTAFESAQTQLEDLCEKPAGGSWTPIERLTVAEGHLNAMLGAIKTIKPAMETLYASLSDDQKKRMDALRPDWRMRLPWNQP